MSQCAVSPFVPARVTLRLFDGLALGMVLDGVVFLVERLADLKRRN